MSNTCPRCNGPVEQPARGRPRIYCSGKCKVSVHDKKKREQVAEQRAPRIRREPAPLRWGIASRTSNPAPVEPEPEVKVTEPVVVEAQAEPEVSPVVVAPEAHVVLPEEVVVEARVVAPEVPEVVIVPRTPRPIPAPRPSPPAAFRIRRPAPRRGGW